MKEVTSIIATTSVVAWCVVLTQSILKNLLSMRKVIATIITNHHLIFNPNHTTQEEAVTQATEALDTWEVVEAIVDHIEVHIVDADHQEAEEVVSTTILETSHIITPKPDSRSRTKITERKPPGNTRRTHSSSGRN